MLLAGGAAQEPELRVRTGGCPASRPPAPARAASAPETPPAPPPAAAAAGPCAHRRHPSVPVLQPRRGTGPPSRWRAVGHSPGTVPALAFNLTYGVSAAAWGRAGPRGLPWRMGTAMVDGDPAQRCACLGHPGMARPLHPRHASYGVRETTGTCRGVLPSLPGLGVLAHGGGQPAPGALPPHRAGTPRWV